MRRGDWGGVGVVSHLGVPSMGQCHSEYPSQSSDSGERLYHDPHSLEGNRKPHADLRTT